MNTHSNSMMLLCNRHIDQTKLARAVTTAEDLVKWAKKYQDGCLMSMTVGQQFIAVSRFFARMSETEIEQMASLNAAQVAEELCELWEQGSPDLCVDGVRSSHARIMISISDPGSRAYQIVQHAKLLGLLDAVGAI